MTFIEDEFGIPTDVLEEINHHVLENADFPLYYRHSYTTEQYPYFSHTLMPREELDGVRKSVFFDFFNDILLNFCYKYQISVERVTRACVNSTIHHDTVFSEPHVDYTEDHKVVIMYLNDCDGDTIIFDKKYTDGPTHLSVEDGESMSVFKRVTPKAGKILLFDGNKFHTNIFPSPGKFRFVCVFTFLCS
jgi:hypothetical protein